MTFLGTEDPLWQTLSSIVEDEGLTLYDAERVGGSLLRVVIDGPLETDCQADRQGARPGVTSGQCSTVCRRLMVFFEAEGQKYGVNNEVQLEVSSPGINRQLRVAQHFSRAVGQRIKIIRERERSGSKAEGAGGPIFGELCRVEDGVLTVMPEGEEVGIEIPMAEIKTASVAYKF